MSLRPPGIAGGSLCYHIFIFGEIDTAWSVRSSIGGEILGIYRSRFITVTLPSELVARSVSASTIS